MKPTEKEINIAVNVINELAIFAANHGVWTKEVPELVKTLNWLKTLKDTDTVRLYEGNLSFRVSPNDLPPPRSDGE